MFDLTMNYDEILFKLLNYKSIKKRLSKSFFSVKMNLIQLLNYLANTKIDPETSSG